MSKPKNKMEFSKKILICTFVIALIIVVYAMFIQYLIIVHDYHGGTEIIVTLISALGVEIAAGTSFYYWKAKSENILKIKNFTDEEMIKKIEDEFENHR